ncbi:hypothetical protein F4778DRAFT_756667 [Xylariomycetidae sp. FL2044]|nr:hypothetical protein F4778DRAFT_756667 [Xylariomycetidae sp. FL2044]
MNIYYLLPAIYLPPSLCLSLCPGLIYLFIYLSIFFFVFWSSYFSLFQFGWLVIA